jgi:multisubunit Na+/H+ antiporter MnhB subunit
MDLSNLNFLAILVGGLLAWGFGSLWYSPLLFSKAWQTESGMSDDDLKNANMVKIFGGSFALMLVMSFGMAILLRGHEDPSEVTFQTGLMHGLYVGLMFVATSIGINQLYQRKSLKLFFIDAGYQVIMLMIMGAVIGAWA